MTMYDVKLPVMTGYDPADHLTDEGYFRPMRPLGEVIDAHQTALARKQEELAASLWEEFLHTPVGIQGLRDTGEYEKADLYEAEREAYRNWFSDYRSHIIEVSDPQLDEDYGYDPLGCDMWGWDDEGWNVVFESDEDEAIHCFTEDKRDPAGYDFWGFDEEGLDRLGYKVTTEEQEPGSGIYFYRDGRTIDGFDRGGFNRRKWSRAADRAASNHQGVGEGSIHQDTGTIYDPQGYTVEWGEGFWQRARDSEGYKRNGYHYLTELDREGYDAEGYDAEGYDREGFDRNGFSPAGIHRITGTKFDLYHLDRDGYDAEGYKAYRNPYDGKVKLLRRDGYSKSGTDMNGFNRKGLKRGFSKHTLRHEDTGSRYNEAGRDINGIDRDGKDRWGNHASGRSGRNGEPSHIFLVEFEGMPANTEARFELEELVVPREERTGAPEVEWSHDAKQRRARERWERREGRQRKLRALMSKGLTREEARQLLRA